MKQPDWEHIRHFRALARTLNLELAAGQLRTSRVTVMRRVKALEGQLSTTLFVRRKDGHRLTVAGQALFELTHEAEEIFGGIGGVIGNPDQGNQGQVRIVTTEIGANWILLPHIAGFQRAFPQITLNIDASPGSLDLQEDVETLALRFKRPEHGNFTVKKLGAMRFAIYAARRARSREASYIGWAGPFSEIGLSRWLGQVFANRQPSLRLTTIQGHIESARAGVGLVGLPVFIGRKFEELEELPHVGQGFELDAWLVVPQQDRKIARVRSVAKFIDESFSKAIRS